MSLPPPLNRPPRNRLLAKLEPDVYQALLPQLERLALPIKAPFYHPQQPLAYVYFPETLVGSILQPMADGTAVEVGTVGNEGLLGLPVFLGVEQTPSLSFVQVPGETLRLPVSVFRQFVEQYTGFQQLLHRYTQAFFTQLAQSVACNRLHPIDQRCSRWLLMTHDRVEGDHYSLTQEFLGQMLGVRRASVSEVCQALQAAGLIDYVRGQITILDRCGLEATSCECYAIVKAEYDRLLA